MDRNETSGHPSRSSVDLLEKNGERWMPGLDPGMDLKETFGIPRVPNGFVLRQYGRRDCHKRHSRFRNDNYIGGWLLRQFMRRDCHGPERLRKDKLKELADCTEY